MKRLPRKIRTAFEILLWEVDYMAFEVFNGICMLVLGISFYFSTSSRTIARYTIGSVDGITIINIIAGVMIIFGILKVYAISQRKIVTRKWLALCGTFLWGFLFTLFSQPPVKPTSIVFMMIIIAFSIWAYIRLVLKHRGRRLIDPRDSFKNE